MLNRSVLIVEDDVALAEEVQEVLTSYGMRVFHAADWDAAQELVREKEPDLILLDQWLGDRDTLASLPALRSLSNSPIVVLTGNRAEVDRIIGLELGADDFLLKPISGRELVARIRARLRASPDKAAAPVQDQQGWRLSELDRRVYGPDGEPVPLTSAEFELLATLARKPGVVFDRDALTRHVLRRATHAEDRAIDNLVMQVRRKLGAGGENVISTVRGVGYSFTRFPQS